MWNVLERVGLPVYDENGNVVESLHKFPGQTITKAEMTTARQTDEDIKLLEKSGAIEVTS